MPQQYVRLSLDLCSSESSCGEDEKARIMANVTRLFEAGVGGDPKAPGAEPGLTTKSERAAVGAASLAWVEMLKRSQSGDPVQGTHARMFRFFGKSSRNPASCRISRSQLFILRSNNGH